MFQFRTLYGALCGTVTALALCSAAHASQRTDQEFLTVTSDARPGKTYRVFLNQDVQGDITGIDYVGSKTEHFDISVVRKGVVMLEESGRKVVVLSAPNLSTKDGGLVQVQYLVSGIDNSTAVFKYDLIRVGPLWVNYTLTEQGRREFKSLFLKKNVFLGKVIGISKIIPQ